MGTLCIPEVASVALLLGVLPENSTFRGLPDSQFCPLNSGNLLGSAWFLLPVPCLVSWGNYLAHFIYLHSLKDLYPLLSDVLCLEVVVLCILSVIFLVLGGKVNPVSILHFDWQSSLFILEMLK